MSKQLPGNLEVNDFYLGSQKSCLVWILSGPKYILAPQFGSSLVIRWNTDQLYPADPQIHTVAAMNRVVECEMCRGAAYPHFQIFYPHHS